MVEKFAGLTFLGGLRNWLVFFTPFEKKGFKGLLSGFFTVLFHTGRSLFFLRGGDSSYGDFPEKKGEGVFFPISPFFLGQTAEGETSPF